jgi:hypothetical protein
MAFSLVQIKLHVLIEIIKNINQNINQSFFLSSWQPVNTGSSIPFQDFFERQRQMERTGHDNPNRNGGSKDKRSQDLQQLQIIASIWDDNKKSSGW